MASGTTLQGFPPLLPAGPIAALILGSFPSVVSLRTGEYYGNPQNWFWRVLQACGAIPDADAPYDERVSALTSLGIAVWDLYATVEREGSGDDRIQNARPNRIADLYGERGSFRVLLNGRRSREWRRSFGDLSAEVIALPSTSPRPLHWNTAADREAAIEEWRRALADVAGD